MGNDVMNAQDRIALLIGKMIIEGEVRTDELNAAKAALAEKEKADDLR
jgi:hypothetical protein